MNISIFKKLFLLIYISMFFIGFGFAQQERSINGSWMGQLDFSNMKFRIIFNIKRGNDKYIATMDSPDQGTNNIPVNSVTLIDSSIKFDVKALGGYYKGIINKESTFISGMWHQGGDLQLNLTKIDKNQVTKKTISEQILPHHYKVENVVYKNKKSKIKISATLTLPDSGNHFTAVILIPASGKYNRNEESFGHEPFKLLADYLTRNGIAVLRYDSRGVGGSTGNYETASAGDFESDVIAGINFLKSKKMIDSKKIGLIGQDEGGIIASLVARKIKSVAFIVLMAAPGIPCDQLLIEQSAVIAKLEGASDAQINNSLRLNRVLYNIIKTTPDSSLTYQKLHLAYIDYFNNLKEPTTNIEKTFAMQSKVLLNPWFRFFISYNPALTFEKVKCPVLAINGDKDVQVPSKENLDNISKALKDGGNKNYKVVELPGLNHLFQTSKTGSPLEYAQIKETIAPIALKTIVDWILKINNKKK